MQVRASRRGHRRRGTARGQSSPGDEGAADAIDVARYIADMTARMEAMAAAAKLDFLAYLLGMARAESQTIAGGEEG